MKPFQLSIDQLYIDFGTSASWLSQKEAETRLAQHGLNQIKEKDWNWFFEIFLHQFASALVLILCVAALISGLIGEWVDALIIFGVVLINAIFGAVQEYKADQAIASLKKLSGLKAKVLRDGKESQIAAENLTLGDVIILDTGDKIPADARIIESVNLQLQESILTGESVSVAKHSDPIEQSSVLADLKNMLFSGTVITQWRGRAVVTAIWMDTEIGKIADMMQQAPEKKTNLEKKLDKLSKILGVATILICILIFIAYYFSRDLPLQEAFLIAIALAVAAIPEGLAAVVTISLGLGVKRFIKKNVLVRRLSSVETLGSVNVICTDKTWTLTKNEMTVTKLFVNDEIIELSGIGYKPEGSFSADPQTFQKLLEIGVLANNAKLDDEEIIWDPTEWALLVSAAKAGISQESLSQDYQWRGELSFDSERKLMSVLYTFQDQDLIFTKGAPENLLARSSSVWIDGEIIPLDEEKRQKILTQSADFSQEALRVLGFAYGYWDQESDLIFVWLQAMIDPPRPEAKQAIQQCKNAGIRVIMITGDNAITAKAIAEQLGIEGGVMTGEEFEKSEDQLMVIAQTGVFARVNPMHKQTIVKLLQSQGNIVAMTWDGVNDAPALKMADIGIGMGITGTEVTKEAADMILTDDNFASIVGAVHEWRGIYENIQKFINYLLASNIGEILILFLASLMGLPLPLLAIHLLWLNLVTDGLPAIALGVDPINPNVMNHPPRPANQSILTRPVLINIAILAMIMAGAAIFLMLRNSSEELIILRSWVFLLLTCIELIKIQIIRYQYGLWLLSNKRLLLAILGSIGSVLLLMYVPALAAVFSLSPLSVEIWQDLGCILLAVAMLGAGLSRLLVKLKKHIH